MSRWVEPAGPVIIEIDGFEAVMKLLDADRATISANAVGLPPTARARLIASGTITMVAPTWLITIENAVVSSASTSSITHTGRPSGRGSEERRGGKEGGGTCRFRGSRKQKK